MTKDLKRAETDPGGSTTTHRIGRRTVAKGAAWTAPVVLMSVTAPAIAASPVPCTPKTATLTTTSNIVTSVVFPGGIVGTVTYSENGYDDATPVDTGRKYTTLFPTGGNYDYIMLRHEGLMDKGWWVAVTITFDEAVTKLSLNLTDIDKDTGEWIDHVIVTPNSFGHAFAVPTGTQPNNIPEPFVTGTGTAADPFRATGDYSLVLERNNGDVTLTWPGPVTEVTVKFLAFDSVGGSANGQHIGVGNFVLGC